MKTNDRNFISSVSDGKKLYWITERTGLGMCLDVAHKKAEFIEIPWKDVGIKPYGNAVLSVDEKNLYAVSCFGKYFVIYNFVDHSIKAVDIGIKDMYAQSFCFSKRIGNEVAFLPYQSNEVIYVDLSTGQQRTVRITSNADKDFCGIYYAGIKQAVDGPRVPLFDSNRNELLLYDLLTENTLRKPYPCLIDNPLYVQETEENYYLLTLSGKVYCLDKITMDAVCVYECEGKNEQRQFAAITVQNGMLWLLPWLGEQIVRVNLSDKSFECFEACPDDLYYFDSDKMSKYTGFSEIDGDDFCCMHSGNYMFCIEKNGRGSFLEIKWPSANEYARQLTLISDVIMEGELELEDYIGGLVLEK